jgi:hypothetical protein
MTLEGYHVFNMKKKHLFTGLTVLFIVLVVGYIAIPIIVKTIISNKILENKNNSFNSITVSWSGPQVISGLEVQDTFARANIDVTINNSIISLLSSSEPIKATINGDAVYHTSPKEIDGSPAEYVIQEVTTSSNSTFPSLILDVSLNSFTLLSEDEMVFSNVIGSLDVAPSHHFTGHVTAETDLDGIIEANFNAPNLINGDGSINWSSSGTISFSANNAAIPTVKGVGGWSVIELNGEISSPNLNESVSIAISASLAEYETTCGSVLIKTQLSNPIQNGSFVIEEEGLVGSAEFSNTPTTMFAPILHPLGIDSVRDIGNTFNLSLQRTAKNSPLSITIEAKELVVSGAYDGESGVITNANFSLNVKDELLQSITKEQMSGNVKINVHLDRLVPVGATKDTLIGNLSLIGDLVYEPDEISITKLDANIFADVLKRQIFSSGDIVANKQTTNFGIDLYSTNKNKLDGIDDLWKTISRQFPKGSGTINLENISTTLLSDYINTTKIDLTRDIGKTINAEFVLDQSIIMAHVHNKQIDASGALSLKDNTITNYENIRAIATITKELSSELTGTHISSTAELGVHIDSIDKNLNSKFELTFDIGNQHTGIIGTSTRIIGGDLDGQLNLDLSVDGIDTRLIDAITSSRGLLADTVGTPIKAEIIANNVLEAPIVIADGTSPNAAFKTTIVFFDGKMSTPPNKPTIAEITLSQSLTQHLLKNLGPVLSDIRSVKKPIEIKATNSLVSLDGDVSKLNADLMINIGEVSLDSSSLTLSLLKQIKTKHSKSIPAYFEPIHITIRDGIVTYKTFRLVVANKFTIPYSGTINLVTRELDLEMAVPASELSAVFSELHNLKLGNIPVHITGTIDNPKDEYNIEKFLLDTFGNSLGGVFDNNEAPVPIDLLDGLFGN